MQARHAVTGLTRAIRHPTKALGSTTSRLKKKITKPIRALRHEAEIGPLMHDEVLAALRRMKEQNSQLAKVLDKAYGYAVVPSIGRAAAVLGGAYGIGEVFEQGRVAGYAAIVQVTIGVQLGGVTFHELVVFPTKDSLEHFKKGGKLAFAANASVALVKAGAEAAKGFGDGTQTFVFSEGGLLLSLAIGGQKLIFRQAALGRLRTAEDKPGRHAARPDGHGEERPGERAEERGGERDQPPSEAPRPAPAH